MDTDRLKIFYLKKKIIFPFCTLQVTLSRSEFSLSLKIGDKIAALPIRTMAGVFFYRNKIATMAEVLEIQSDDEYVRLLLKGLSRIRIKNINKARIAECEPIELFNNTMNDDLCEDLRKKAQEMVFLINIKESDKLIDLLSYLVDLGQLTDFQIQIGFLNKQFGR